MSNHALVDHSRATSDVQVIADMAAAVLASIARMHADGLAAVVTLAESPRPIRVELPPVAEEVPEMKLIEQPAVTEEPAEPQLVEEDAEAVHRIPVAPPLPRGRHLLEMETDQLPALHVA
jgi:hypothetical protein